MKVDNVRRVHLTHKRFRTGLSEEEFGELRDLNDKLRRSQEEWLDDRAWLHDNMSLISTQIQHGRPGSVEIVRVDDTGFSVQVGDYTLPFRMNQKQAMEVQTAIYFNQQAAISATLSKGEKPRVEASKK